MQATGRLDEALRLFDRSIRLAPHLPTEGRRASFMAHTHLLAGHDQEALAYANKSLIADPESRVSRWVRASVYGRQGRKDLAEKALDELISRDRDLDTIEKVARQYRHVVNMEIALEGLRRAGMRER
jgi:tetratricopeptide (TPR) repeat protein